VEEAAGRGGGGKVVLVSPELVTGVRARGGEKSRGDEEERKEKEEEEEEDEDKDKVRRECRDDDKDEAPDE
jgi:hypothetical protein